MSNATAWVIDVTEETFEQLVLVESRTRPVVVDFWAPWCAPCRALGPVLEKLIEERQGAVILAKVNTDECPNLAAYFRLGGIPAVKAFKDGQLVDEFEGVQPVPLLEQFLDRLAPKADPELDQARALEESQPAEAEAVYRRRLEAEPDNDAVRLGLVRALAAQGKTAEVEEALAPLPAGGEVGAEVDRIRAGMAFAELTAGVPDEAELRRAVAADEKDAQARYRLGCVLARKGDFPAALAALLAAGERDYKLLTGPVREAMVKVFHAIGADHALANEYRSKLARLLY